MTRERPRIGMISPVAWRTPPRAYGAWETVASNITEELVRRGWDVTLFATKDSITKARLLAVVERGYEEDTSVDPKVCEYLHLSEAFERADEFDLIHSHYDFMSLAYSKLVKPPVLITIHGFSSPKILPVYRKYNGYVNYVSISNADRVPDLNYVATIYNGIDTSLYTFHGEPGEYLVFLGRIHPDKGTHLACEAAKKSGRRLIIAGIIQDEKYFEDRVRPYIDDTNIQFIGAVDIDGKNRLFKQAYAVLHLNELPERFGLVLVEANAAGVPVLAMDRGSCREVIQDGETGFLVNNVDEAVKALERIPDLDRFNCRSRVEKYFSVQAMVDGYEEVYNRILNHTGR
jgi:glycosyltransferase involved in cell wall biosynthesis